MRLFVFEGVLCDLLHWCWVVWCYRITCLVGVRRFLVSMTTQPSEHPWRNWCEEWKRTASTNTWRYVLYCTYICMYYTYVCTVPTYICTVPTLRTYVLYLRMYCTYVTYVLYLHMYCTYVTYVLYLRYVCTVPTLRMYCTYVCTVPTYICTIPTYVLYLRTYIYVLYLRMYCTYVHICTVPTYVLYLCMYKSIECLSDDGHSLVLVKCWASLISPPPPGYVGHSWVCSSSKLWNSGWFAVKNALHRWGEGNDDGVRHGEQEHGSHW